MYNAILRLTNLATLSAALIISSAILNSRTVKAEGSLEAIMAPQIGLAMGSGSRTRFGIDFYRVSSGPSLSVHYGLGGDYNDLTLLFRLSNHYSLAEDSSTGFIYGVGLGYTWGMDSTDTAQDSFGSTSINPYLRYLLDLNGRVGAYLELGYEYSVAGFKYGSNAPSSSDIKSNNNRFIIAFGIPFEAERARPE